MSKDLFGNEIITNPLLRDKFIEPPFSILDTKSGNWQRRKKEWKRLGIKSEIGRDTKSINSGTDDYRDIKNKVGYDNKEKYTSIFDPALCEILYHWFCVNGKEILDPFAGGSVRGIVANYLGYNYTGVEIRQEQIDSNREQAVKILDVKNQPNWYVGDSNEVLNNFSKEFDFIFSCPPYADLEVYSNLKGDISNMPYIKFMKAYEDIIAKSCNLLKSGGYACFVVGEVRDKKGNYIGFVPDTINAFKKCGMNFYNEAILLNPIASASMRANGNMKTEKLVKVHQNVLIFKKP
jgi:DNA modification methylase|tara:strand:- start:2 stop:877 length:876 start_codon:yes stop_codon:yes gene_type:complete